MDPVRKPYDLYLHITYVIRVLSSQSNVLYIYKINENSYISPYIFFLSFLKKKKSMFG